MRQNTHPASYFQSQILLWEDKFARSVGAARKAYCQDMLNELIHEDEQFRKVLRAFQAQGLGLILKSWKNWCVITEDREHPSFYRFQVFNETGLVAHCTRMSPEAVLLEAFQAGFKAVDDSNALHRLSRNPRWDSSQVSHLMPPASV